MRIRLDLTRHCIETELRRRHEAAMSRYFKKPGARTSIEGELVLLEKALAAFDFGRLRSRWPVLAGGEKSAVHLTADDTGRPFLLAGRHRIHPPAVQAPASRGKA
jgi:hypothetical protein